MKLDSQQIQVLNPNKTSRNVLLHILFIPLNLVSKNQYATLLKIVSVLLTQNQVHYSAIIYFILFIYPIKALTLKLEFIELSSLKLINIYLLHTLSRLYEERTMKWMRLRVSK